MENPLQAYPRESMIGMKLDVRSAGTIQFNVDRFLS